MEVQWAGGTINTAIPRYKLGPLVLPCYLVMNYPEHFVGYGIVVAGVLYT